MNIKSLKEIYASQFIRATILITLALVMFSFFISIILGKVAQGLESEECKNIIIKVNGKAIDFPDAKPFIADNRTHVPTRFIAEYLGARVQWDNNSKFVTILKDPELITKRIIKYKVGERRIYINDDEKLIDTEIIIKADRSYAPIRIIAETLGAIVKWDEEEKMVVINTSTRINTSVRTVENGGDKITPANLIIAKGEDSDKGEDSALDKGTTKGESSVLDEGSAEGEGALGNKEISLNTEMVEDIIGDNYKVCDDRLYIYSYSKKEYIDVAKYSTIYTPKDLANIARYIHNALKNMTKYFICSFNGEEQGDISFIIFANKDQYYGDRINRASISVTLLTNSNSEYVKRTGRYIDIGFTNITNKVNYLPSSDINEYLSIVKNLLKLILRDDYSDSYYLKFEDYVIKKENDLSREDLFKGKVDAMYMKLYNSPFEYKTRLYLTDKELN